MNEALLEYRLCAFVTVLVFLLNVRSGLAVGTARDKYNLKAPICKGPPEFERVFRAHANNAEQYPQFLALMWVFAVMVHANLAGLMGMFWIILRHLYVSAYHNGGAIANYTIPAYLLLFAYSAGIVGVCLWSVAEDYM